MYELIYDAENRLVQVKKNIVSIATFIHDGDGARVMSVIDGVKTRCVGNHYEVTGSVLTKYYYAGGTRIAIRKDGTMSYMLSDHLSSTSLVTNASGAVISEMRHTSCPLRFASGMLREGEVHYENGTTPTEYTYTGQFSYTADFGLVFTAASFSLLLKVSSGKVS